MNRYILHLIVIFHCLFLVLGDQKNLTTQRTERFPATTPIPRTIYNFSQAYGEILLCNSTLAVNSSIKMKCSRDANESKNFVWWFGENILKADSPSYFLSYGNINIWKTETKSTLIIHHMNKNNTGLYKCAVGKTTVMEHFLNVEDPKLTISCDQTDCNQILQANVSGRYTIYCYINQIPLYKPLTWKISSRGKMSEKIVSGIDTSDRTENIQDDMQLASILFYTADKNHDMITCSMGEYFTNVTVQVLYEPDNWLPFIILAAVIFVVALAISVIISFAYCCFNITGCPSEQKSPSLVPNVLYENGSRAKELDEKEEFTKRNNDDPCLLPVCQEWKRIFEHNNAVYGLKLLCCRYEDDMDIFSEAVFVEGDYKERFVIRSMSGKSTLENLEEFRKFQVRLVELQNHSNILSVLGCYTNKLPYRICYEYFPNKTIRDYFFEDFQNIQNSQMHEVQAQKLLCIAHGVARGLFFLKENELDHVAIRVEKVLYYGASICKLYDFSLRSQAEKKAMMLLEKSESLAWLGPDILLRKEYNHRTDVWAYGVLMWELWSGGQTPFYKSTRLTMEMNMRNGKVLQQPPNCPGTIYSLMLSCWKTTANERCSYRDIVTEIENLNASKCETAVENYEVEPVPGPSFFTSLDESAYDHLSTL